MLSLTVGLMLMVAGSAQLLAQLPLLFQEGSSLGPAFFSDPLLFGSILNAYKVRKQPESPLHAYRELPEKYVARVNV